MLNTKNINFARSLTPAMTKFAANLQSSFGQMMSDPNGNPNYIMNIGIILRDGRTLTISRNVPFAEHEEDDDCIEFEVVQDILANGFKISGYDTVKQKDRLGYSNPFYYSREIKPEEVLSVEVSVEERENVV